MVTKKRREIETQRWKEKKSSHFNWIVLEYEEFGDPVDLYKWLLKR